MPSVIETKVQSYLDAVASIAQSLLVSGSEVKWCGTYDENSGEITKLGVEAMINGFEYLGPLRVNSSLGDAHDPETFARIFVQKAHEMASQKVQSI